ncbi:MAG: CocE/NonD family hydrolase [Alphaproteobacteria bacterium]|nr:CocE/NonD family hydrolase [Alphaproteobacteria bacterium]MBU1516764.1 CocE/NonD family hydrolase [Alphaproteobacteria bacterium]MBU2092458.1 CocE/NonD family hydrolase [Alphaproteobacteria bacterium]MBU2152411.1 CocE/NonD family hydrolase [Alphaproteobacteria bacterium]MBU2305622.1 CocE/NonD family hydrolase [Alphaproteobacteria bacterium]
MAPVGVWVAGALLALTTVMSAAAAPPVDTLPSDINPAYRASTAEADYVRREAMIPMRDGVKLYTLIVMRKGVARAPILLERTPYGADGNLGRTSSQRLDQLVPASDAPYVEDGYIRVWQDVRGRGRSEGTYVTNRPLSGPLNPTCLDHATDTYDTLEWLTHNIPETNGRVGVIGGSYAGFTSLMATLSGHPALKAAVPINPMVDVWMGDDWYHNGAFRQITLNVLPIIMATKQRGPSTATGAVDLYARMLETGSAGDYMRRYGLDVFPAAQRFIDHAAYDGWWQGQALDKLMAARPIVTPMLLVGGLYDEQDLYGAPAVFRALHPLDKDRRVSLLMGPWAHMGVNGDGSSLGPIRFGEDTAAKARRDIIKPFLDAHLKDGGNGPDLPPVISFATGGGGWRRSEEIAQAGTALYLRGEGRLSFERPTAAEPKDDYISDPAKPVGVIARPFFFGGRSDSWKTSLIADQRFAGQRTDVLTYVTPPLDKAVHIFGQPQVELFAATTGTDSDFVVKLIDVYPDEMEDPDLGGYQLPVGMDIFRGRYLKALDRPAPLTPGKAEAYHFALPMADHVFAKGHRIMVQVQSSWFPVYDRNPQTFVPNIFNARPQDYRKATQSVFHDPVRASAVRLPIVND